MHMTEQAELRERLIMRLLGCEKAMMTTADIIKDAKALESYVVGNDEHQEPRKEKQSLADWPVRN